MALTQEHFYNKSFFRNTLPERRCHAPKKLLNKRRSYGKTTTPHHQIRMSWHKKSIVVDMADIFVDMMVILDTLAYGNQLQLQYGESEK